MTQHKGYKIQKLVNRKSVSLFGFALIPERLDTTYTILASCGEYYIKLHSGFFSESCAISFIDRTLPEAKNLKIDSPANLGPTIVREAGGF